MNILDFGNIDKNKYIISFIKQKDFEDHVAKTISTYNETLKSIDLKQFNDNVIDPIKLTFDRMLFKKSWEEIISLEIHRQRDKSNTNSIGYFHQNLFKYIDRCEVPVHGFDIVYKRKDGTCINVEMKNKHNTMNSSSSQKTYLNMKNYLDGHPDDKCYLVEVIAPKSRNIVWEITVNGVKQKDERIKRVSIDYFYYEVTGIKDAFYQICCQLPNTIAKLIDNKTISTVQEDTVIKELKEKDSNLLSSLYLLAFDTYLGFESNSDKLKKLIKDYENSLK